MQLNIFRKEINLLIFLLVINIFLRFIAYDIGGTFDVDVFIERIKILEIFSPKTLYIPGLEVLIESEMVTEDKAKSALSGYPIFFVYIYKLIAVLKVYLDSINIILPYVFYHKLPIIISEIVIFTFLFNNLLNKNNELNSKVLLYLLLINPTFLYASYFLGYLFYFLFFFLFFSYYFLIKDKVYLSIIFFTLGLFTNQMLIIITPVIFIFLIKNYKLRQIVKFFIFFIFVCLLIVSEFIISDVKLIIDEKFDYYSSYSIGFLRTMYYTSGGYMISANSINFWWIFSSFYQILTSLNEYRNGSIPISNLFDIKILTLNDLGLYPRQLSLIALIFFTTINMFLLFKNKIDLASACFLQSYSYVMTNIQIHENHMLFVLIFLFLKIFKTETNKSVLAEHVLISFFAIANLFLFYGLFGSIDKSYYHNILIIIVSIFNLSYFIRKYLTVNTHQ